MLHLSTVEIQLYLFYSCIGWKCLLSSFKNYFLLYKRDYLYKHSDPTWAEILYYSYSGTTHGCSRRRRFRSVRKNVGIRLCLKQKYSSERGLTYGTSACSNACWDSNTVFYIFLRTNEIFCREGNGNWEISSTVYIYHAQMKKMKKLDKKRKKRKKERKKKLCLLK